MLKWLFILVVVVLLVLVLAVAAVVAGQLGFLQGRAPDNLGLREGKLKPPSKTPNSVSSQADLWPGHEQADYARIAALPLAGDGAATLARIQAIVAAMPGARVVKSQPDYLYATFTTPLMKYTDDVEFWFDPAARAVQVRSASRLGRKDLGANRARIEAIRARLAAD